MNNDVVSFLPVSEIDEFERKISSLDVSLFDHIESQTLLADRLALLALQNALREEKKSFSYLEIGSHLGGSIQPYLLDPRCVQIYSIDSRPLSQPHERNLQFSYDGNSTERMLSNLERLSKKNLPKIRCFDAEAKNVDPQLIRLRPDFCFIDGEHTFQAVVSDFKFCHSVVKPNGAIAFHDSNIIFEALNSIIHTLTSENLKFRAYNLSGSVFVVELGDSTLFNCEKVRELLASNHKEYISVRLALKRYHALYQMLGCRLLRRLNLLPSIPQEMQVYQV